MHTMTSKILTLGHIMMILFNCEMQFLSGNMLGWQAFLDIFISQQLDENLIEAYLICVGKKIIIFTTNVWSMFFNKFFLYRLLRAELLVLT